MYNVLLVCAEIDTTARDDLRKKISLMTESETPTTRIGLMRVNNLKSAKNLINNGTFDVLVVDSKLTSNINQLRGITKMPPLLFLNNWELEQVFAPKN